MLVRDAEATSYTAPGRPFSFDPCATFSPVALCLLRCVCLWQISVMPLKRMTANPVRPARYRPGKPIGPEASSEEDESDEDVDADVDADVDVDESSQGPTRRPAPKASSYPTDSTRIAHNLKNVDLNERKRQAARDEAVREKREEDARRKEEEGFVTEEESEEESEEDDEESGSEEEESSDDEAPKRTLLRPTFIKKDKRQATTGLNDPETEEAWQAREEERKKAADEIVEEQLRKDAELRAAGKKDWDDDEAGEIDQVDDADGLEPEAERAAWRLRELRRVKREREAIEEAEQEREEVERRRNLSQEERDAEDAEYLAQQRGDKESRGQMGYMQKYFHKGAFFQDDAKDKGLDRRDIMGSRYQDDVTNRELLPQYMQIRDMTRLGRKGRTKYKDLQSEDTGRWGAFDDRRGRGGRPPAGSSHDERFMPDHLRDRGDATGANASVVNERRRTEAAPSGLRASSDREPGDRRDARSRRKDDSPARRPEYRSPSRSPRRSHHDEDHHKHDRRKRSPSPYDRRRDDDKRRKVAVG
ncbi:MAG: hypothetical protein M1838_005948 [Thelocarpon superellum]|nr:MAG: hypothetical protein M1838_005948 [Thelocarpon superellum]